MTEVNITEKILNQLKNEEWLYDLAKLSFLCWFFRTIYLKTMQVTTQENTHNKRVTALIGMLHTVFCILFTLHQRPSTLRGTAVLRVVMNSNQRGGNGKSWVLPVANLNKYLSNLHKYSGNGTDSSRSSQVWSQKVYMVKTIAVNLKLWLQFKTSHEIKEKSEGKGHFPPPPTVTTAGLAKCSGCEPATRAKQVTTLLSC